MKKEKLTAEQLEKERGRPKRARGGEWKGIIDEIKKTGEAVKITELTRGSLAAGYRAAKDAGLDYISDYKNLTLIIAPKQPEPSKRAKA